VSLREQPSCRGSVRSRGRVCDVHGRRAESGKSYSAKLNVIRSPDQAPTAEPDQDTEYFPRILVRCRVPPELYIDALRDTQRDICLSECPTEPLKFGLVGSTTPDENAGISDVRRRHTAASAYSVATGSSAWRMISASSGEMSSSRAAIKWLTVPSTYSEAYSRATASPSSPCRSM